VHEVSLDSVFLALTGRSGAPSTSVPQQKESCHV